MFFRFNGSEIENINFLFAPDKNYETLIHHLEATESGKIILEKLKNLLESAELDYDFLKTIFLVRNSCWPMTVKDICTYKSTMIKTLDDVIEKVVYPFVCAKSTDHASSV